MNKAELIRVLAESLADSICVNLEDGRTLSNGEVIAVVLNLSEEDIDKGTESVYVYRPYSPPGSKPFMVVDRKWWDGGSRDAEKEDVNDVL